MATVKRVFVVTSDPSYCSLVLVNRGVTVSEDGSSAVVEFQLYGPATELLCSLDGGNQYVLSVKTVKIIQMKELLYRDNGSPMQTID